MSAGRKATVQLLVKLTPEQDTRIRALAQARGVSLRQLVVDALLGEVASDARLVALEARLSALEESVKELQASVKEGIEKT